MVKSNNEKVLVIGGGLAGLASACTLAARGYKVELFEKNDWLGGKAAVLEKEGYRFDMGPTILTIPSILARIFSEAGRKMEDYIPMVKLEPQWRSFFDDGSILDLVSDEKTMQENLGKFGPNCASGYKKFLQYSERLNRISQRFRRLRKTTPYNKYKFSQPSRWPANNHRMEVDALDPCAVEWNDNARANKP